MEECPELDCKSLVSLHAVKAGVGAHDCDSELSRTVLDGTLVVRQLVTVFADGDGTSRGVHAGDFVWRNRSFVVQGRIQGITNAGLNRAPLRRECEECRMPGVMIGRLCGTVVRSVDPRCWARWSRPSIASSSSPRRRAAQAAWPARSRARCCRSARRSRRAWTSRS